MIRTFRCIHVVEMGAAMSEPSLRQKDAVLLSTYDNVTIFER